MPLRHQSRSCARDRGVLGAIAVATVACQPTTPPRTPAIVRRPAPAATAMPGPATGAPPGDRLARNRACLQCHADAARSWRESLHRRAWTDPDFAQAQAREPSPFCRSCHAPEADPSAEPEPALAAMGVACVTCHVPIDGALPRDAVLTGVVRHGTAPSPHPLVRSAAFASEQGCARCHEFASPRDPDLLLQATLREHRRLAPDSDGCQSCHMRATPTGLDHRFAASRDPAMLRTAIRADGVRTSSTVQVSLALGEVGHAVPTGDPFRRLAVELDVHDGVRWQPIDRTTLRRRIENRHDGSLYPGRVVTHDDRLGTPNAPPKIHFDVGAYPTRPVRWRVVYERVDFDIEVDEPALFDRIVVASATLPPLATQPEP